MLRHPGQRRALTLLEVIISVGIIGILMAALMTFYWQTVRIHGETAASTVRAQLVHQVLDRIANELRTAVGTAQVGFPVQVFTGTRRSVTFLTAAAPQKSEYVVYRASELAGRPAPRQDIREVTYGLWIDPEDTTEDGQPLVGGLLRTERWAIKPFRSEEEVAEDEDLIYVRHDLLSHEFGYLEFRYFDGVDWTTQWTVVEGNPLPHAVQITIGFDSITNEDLEDQDLERYPLDRYPLAPPRDPRGPYADRQAGWYSMIVQLPAADAMFTSRVQRLSGEVEQIFQFGGQPGVEGGGATEGLEQLEQLRQQGGRR